MIGVVGCTGAVGRAATDQLAAWGVGPLRLGGRDPDRVQQLRDGLAGPADVHRVDIGDRQVLTEFCAGCRVVLNCAGPSTWVLDQVARAAFAVGADYVDAAGDDPVHAALRVDGVPAGRTAVLSAGSMPGLSALLPRALAGSGTDRPQRLLVYTGGVERFTPAAAADYLSSLDNGYGEALASWRDGRVVSRSLTPLADVELPFFPYRVSAYPFLSTEARRLAADLGLAELRWYNVFAGSYFLRALTRVRTGQSAPDAVAELVRAADADIAGRRRHQVFVFRLDDRSGSRTLVLRTPDSYRLTGQVAALATTAVLTGQVRPGVHFTAEALDPVAVLERVRLLDSVDAVEMVDADEHFETIEEGAL